jgi:hypothetical protein
LFGWVMNATMAGVKGRLFKILLLLWLGWFVSGPVAEMIDSWDSPRDEMQDAVRDAGGLATLFAAGLCFALAELRRTQDRLKYLARFNGRRFSSLILKPPTSLPFEAAAFAHSPPTPLRI